jgi:very-short-patch-repair endonuclease
MVECHRCVNICESPLERDLLHNLVLIGINPELQLRISKFNEVGHYPVDVNKESILTIPDFYLENGMKKVCIYTDGHSYHERTENQAMRDRSIDRELQNFGYQVLRFTGKEIREKMDIVIATIKRSIE